MANKEWHTCHFCGENVADGYDFKGERHWLSDCRPDLVEHEIGPTCTWHKSLRRNEKGELFTLEPPEDCYAYQDQWTRQWGTEHIHFYKDGPM